MMKFEHLLTETRHPDTAHIDQLSTREMLEVINAADRSVADAVHAELPRIAQAVDGIAERLEKGGRLFYTGAGTSGRLGVLDASECPPTFNVDPGLVVGLIAGGDHALRHSIEGAEDDARQGAEDLKAHGLRSRGCAGRHRRQRPHTLCAGRHALRQPTGRTHHRAELRPGL